MSAPGGSPYQLFQNERLRMAKRLAVATDLTDAGSMKPEALQRAREAAKEDWRNMAQQQRQEYQTLYNERLVERRALAEAAAAKSDGPSGIVQDYAPSHWGSGTQRHILNPRFVQLALAAEKRMPSKVEVYNTTEFSVEEPEPDQLPDGPRILEACQHRGRNVCPLHPDYKFITTMHNTMRHLCDKLGKAVVDTTDVLVLFEGDGTRSPGAGPVIRHFAVLTHVSFSPKFQEWTLCEPAGGGGGADEQ